MKPLAEPAIAAVERGEIQIIPDNRREEYFNGCEHRDWTLSRNSGGPPDPAWHCGAARNYRGARDPAKCTKCGWQSWNRIQTCWTRG